MFTNLFRVGPLVCLEVCLMAAALILKIEASVKPCFYYTLAYLSLQTFLLEMIFSLKMMKKMRKLRRKFIGQVIEDDKCSFYGYMVWNNMNCLVVLSVLFGCMVSDGIKLNQLNYYSPPDDLTAEKEQCDFTLYSLCLFVQISSKTAFDGAARMVLLLLYSILVFITGLLTIIFVWEYSQYWNMLLQNRKTLNQLHIGVREALLDCKIFTFRSEYDLKTQEEVGECVICLHSLIESNQNSINSGSIVIKLRCNHSFHQECIQKWIKNKDHCPYRCTLSE